MKKLIVALVAVSALGILAVAAGSASAAFEWLCAGESTTTVKCPVLGFNLEIFVLEDMGVPASVECAVETIESEGSVSGATDETTEVTFLEPKSNVNRRPKRKT